MPASSRQNMLFCGNPLRIRNFYRVDVGIDPYKGKMTTTEQRFHHLRYSEGGWFQGRGIASSLVALRGIVKGTGLPRESPLTILSFDRQRRFLSHAGKKAGLKTLQRKPSVQKDCRRQLRSKQEHSECQFRPQARASHGSSRRYRRGTGRAAPHIPPEGRSRETLRFGREPRRRAAAFPREARAAPSRRGMEAERNR